MPPDPPSRNRLLPDQTKIASYGPVLAVKKTFVGHVSFFPAQAGLDILVGAHSIPATVDNQQSERTFSGWRVLTTEHHCGQSLESTNNCGSIFLW